MRMLWLANPLARRREIYLRGKRLGNGAGGGAAERPGGEPSPPLASAASRRVGPCTRSVVQRSCTGGPGAASASVTLGLGVPGNLLWRISGVSRRADSERSGPPPAPAVSSQSRSESQPDGVPGRSCLKTWVVRSGQVMRMRPICYAVVFLLLLAGNAFARVGDPLSGFSTGALMQQLQLTPSSQTADAAGRQIYRYVSDDEVITVDVVVRGGLIEQQLMYVPMDPRRAFQVSFFLQDAVGSVVGAQKGMIAFNAALSNHKETYLTFGGYTMRFTPMGGLVRVLVTGS